MNGVATVEQLKKYYSDLTDKQLLEEIRWRDGPPWTSKMIDSKGAELISNIRTALRLLAAERGLTIQP